MEDSRLATLTPRERDVYEAWIADPDASNALIGRRVYLPAHVVRRYKQQIREKLSLDAQQSPITFGDE
jgi:DNA-binding CsgD family transcriptional regulator